MSSLKKLNLKNQILLTFLFNIGGLLISFLFSFSVWGFYKIDTFSEEDKAASYAVWSVKNNNNYYGLMPAKMGTAFFISPTQLITAFHVIDSLLKDNLNLEDLILTHHRSNQAVPIKKILHLSKFYDLAVLEVDQASPYFLNLVEEASPLDNGLYVIGYHGNKPNKSEEFDKFKQTSPLRDLDYGEMMINYSNLKGLSGGPVLLNGQVRGVVSISFKNLLNFISVNDVKDFLKEDSFSCYNSSAKECLNTAKELFRKNPKQDLKYYYTLLINSFLPKMIHAKKNEEEKNQFWNEFETAMSGLEKMKEKNNNPLFFHLLSEYYRFNSYRFSSSETDKTRNNFKKRFNYIKKGAIAGDRHSQYILSQLQKEANHPIHLSYPLLYSNNSYWLLKAGQNHLSEAQYELGKTYYRYHQNPFLNDFILKSVLYEESLLEKTTDTITDINSDLTQALMFDPSLNFKTNLFQSLRNIMPEQVKQAQYDFFKTAKSYKLQNSHFYHSSSKIDITPFLKNLSNPYNPYQESLNQSEPYQIFNITPLKNETRFETPFYNTQNWLGLNPKKINFSLFENHHQKKSLLVPEDQQSIKSYQDLIAWIFDKEKSFYKTMVNIQFYEELSQFTGCDITREPPIYKSILTDQKESRIKDRQHNINSRYSPHLESLNKYVGYFFSISNSFESESSLQYKLSASLNFLLGKYWLIKAGEQGHAKAQYLLAELYAKNKNQPLAEYWLLKSLNQKDKTAARLSLYLSGLIYANIKEVDQERNTCLARFWLKKAKNYFDHRAEIALRKIEKEEFEYHPSKIWSKKFEPNSSNWNFKKTYFYPELLQYTSKGLLDDYSSFKTKKRGYSLYRGVYDEELIVFNTTAAKGEFLIDRNSSLLNQSKETEFYELFYSRESFYTKIYQMQNQNSLKYNFYPSSSFTVNEENAKIELILSKLYKSNRVLSLPFNEITTLKEILRYYPETIYQIAEESSLLWSK